MPVRFAALSLSLLLAACTRYHYIDPETPEGLACLEKLDAEVSECETNIKNQQDNFEGLYESQMRSAQQCEHFNKLNIPNACPPPPGPTRVDNYCRNSYREKFMACGGKVEKIEE